MYNRILAFFGVTSLASILASFDRTIAQLELHQKNKKAESVRALAEVSRVMNEANRVAAQKNSEAKLADAETARAKAIQAKLVELIK